VLVPEIMKICLIVMHVLKSVEYRKPPWFCC